MTIGRDNCFDALRYVFAISLIIVHYTTLTDSSLTWAISGGMRVKFFFSLTGFLVTYSFIRRNHIVSYVRKRLVRIMPAYICCIVFCLLLGAMLTSLTQSQFWSSGQTWKYLAANLFMLNWLEPSLPGVFENHLHPQMNGSLWSMKFEMIYYAIVPVYVWLMSRYRRVVLALTAIALMMCYHALPIQLQYFCYFLTGSFALVFYPLLMRHLRTVTVISVAALVLIYSGTIIWTPLSEWFFQQVELWAFPMAVVGLGYSLRPLNILSRWDNVSYGLYLYHFPVIQTLLHFFPAHGGGIPMLLSTIAITAVLAIVSWNLLEKPLLKRAN